ncbi:MAG: hypothetical protein QOG62_453 [Thermoleophilaceae bacterium]|nr:hypothetical protein [Thermoleophilaceae bacterium]
MLVAAAPAQANTFTVCAAGCTFPTIQQGIDGTPATPVVPGDTIEVKAGIYDEHVLVNKRLELRGAKANIDARTRASSSGESIITKGAEITTDGVTLNGFRLQDNENGPGILTAPATTGHRILNNVITNNQNGIELDGPPSATTRTYVQQNRIDNNNNAPGADDVDASGIVSSLGVSNVEISANLFGGARINGIRISGPPAPLSEGIDIVGNKFSDDAGIFMQSARSISILANQSLKPGRVSFNAVTFGGDVNGAIIRQNRFIAAEKRQVPRTALDFSFKDTGVLMSNRLGLGPNGQVQVIGNTITDARRGVSISDDPALPGEDAYTGELKVEFNRIVRNSRGVNNTDPSATELVDADNNWWGCNQGPNDALNRCENIGANINFDPWLTLRVAANKDTLAPNGRATDVNATVLRNSAGDTPVSFFPNRTTIGFTATKGRIRKRARTLDGVARTVFSTTSNRGSAKITASLDNESKRAKVDITGGGKKGGGKHGGGKHRGNRNGRHENGGGTV